MCISSQFSSGYFIPRRLNNLSSTCSPGKFGYKAAQLIWSHPEHCIISSRSKLSPDQPRPCLKYQMFLPFPFLPPILFQVSDMRSLCSGSRWSPEMLPAYLVSWHYDYGEIDAISISNSKINRGKQGLGDSDHGNVCWVLEPTVIATEKVLFVMSISV